LAFFPAATINSISYGRIGANCKLVYWGLQELIKKLEIKRKSVRDISRRLGVSTKTIVKVRKYVEA
jgi:hypothetical protein